MSKQIHIHVHKTKDAKRTDTQIMQDEENCERELVRIATNVRGLSKAAINGSEIAAESLKQLVGNLKRI